MIVVPSEPFPLAATDLYQVLETSDLPPGVVNIVTGAHADLAMPLATHMDIDAVWSFSSADVSTRIEAGSISNLKRTWVNHARTADWFASSMVGKPALRQATAVKTIWVPYGE